MKNKFLSLLFILSVSNNIWAEQNFYFKFGASSTSFSDIKDNDATVKILENYKPYTFIHSCDIGFGMKLDMNTSIGIDISYFPNKYSILYNKDKIDDLPYLTLEELSDSRKEELKNTQNFILKDSAGIFLNLNYSLPKMNNLIPFIGFKVGYVSGSIGIDSDFYEKLQAAQKESAKVRFEQDANQAKLDIEIAKLSPLSYGAIFGISSQIKNNIYFDIIYEANKINFENITDQKITNIPNPTLESKGIKKDMILHKISLGLRILL